MEKKLCGCGCNRELGKGLKYYSPECYPSNQKKEPAEPVELVCECGCQRTFTKSKNRRFFEKQCGVNKRASDSFQYEMNRRAASSLPATTYPQPRYRNNQTISNLRNRSIVKKKVIIMEMMDGNYSFDNIAKALNRGNFRPTGHPRRRYSARFVMEEVANDV